MAYRNGTYIAFHANGTDMPANSDIKYYNLLKAWSAKTDDDFAMINSHEKTGAVRDSSTHETLRQSLLLRLRNSKNMVLIIGETTRFDDDWVPLEIEYAVDTYEIPIIAAYPGQGKILNPKALSSLWPEALAERIADDSAKVIHIPFKKQPLAAAVDQFTHDKPPKASLSHYSADAYRNWGIE